MPSRPAIAALLLVLVAGFTHAEEAKTKILLVGKQPDHPAGTHRYLPTLKLLAHCLEQTPRVTAAVSDGWPEDPKLAEAVDGIVLYRSPYTKQMFEGPHAAEIQSLLNGSDTQPGAGLVTIHWAVGTMKEDWDRLSPKMAEYQGGVWRSHSGQVRFGKSQLTRLHPDHPVNRGWQMDVIRDEWYLNPVLGKATPQWQVETEGVPLTVAWSYQRPNGGRTFATSLGHFWENFAREPFRRAMVNAILWSAHREVPADGAPISAVPAELEMKQPALSK